MKTIGYIDYYLDEYHAHNAFTTVKAYNDKNDTDYKIAAAYAEIDSPNGLTTAQFCEKYGIESCSTVAELCEKVDFIIIFSPDNSEKKEGYAIEAVKYGKPIFMDKTFTDSYESAKRIFAAADAANAPMISSSSLRYADELAPYRTSSTSLLVFGSGVCMVDYAVHYLEIVITCMGTGIESVQWEARGEQEWVHLSYRDGRRATIVISMGDYMDFHVLLTDENGKTADFPIVSPFFERQMADVIKFFESGVPSFERAQTLELMKARDAILKSKKENGACVKL